MENSIDYFKNDEYWRRHVHRKLEEDLWIDDYRTELPSPGSALDLGCGIGQFSRRLMEYGYSVFSADISDIALAEVGKFNSQTVKLDMREPLPFGDGTFNLVFANLSIHYFSDAVTKALVAEIQRILKPGGMFVGSVNGMQGAAHISGIAQELEPHYYWNIDRYFRFFDSADLHHYLSPFVTCKVDERETIRFGNKKNYLVFLCKK